MIVANTAGWLGINERIFSADVCIVDFLLELMADLTWVPTCGVVLWRRPTGRRYATVWPVR
jgi:hypothetical protein